MNSPLVFEKKYQFYPLRSEASWMRFLIPSSQLTQSTESEWSVSMDEVLQNGQTVQSVIVLTQM